MHYSSMKEGQNQDSLDCREYVKLGGFNKWVNMDDEKERPELIKLLQDMTFQKDGDKHCILHARNNAGNQRPDCDLSKGWSGTRWLYFIIQYESSSLEKSEVWCGGKKGIRWAIKRDQSSGNAQEGRSVVAGQSYTALLRTKQCCLW